MKRRRTNPTRNLIAVSILLATCAAICGQESDKNSGETGKREILAAIKTQQAAWNRGDIPAFMEYYWKSEKLTFSSGGKTIRGWKTTKERYEKRYPNKAAMGKVTFSGLEWQSLGKEAALVLGRWQLERDDPIGGNFSLVFKRIDGRWLIVHDHSSALEAE